MCCRSEFCKISRRGLGVYRQLGVSMTDSTLDVERPAVKLRIGAHRLSVGSGGVYQHVDPLYRATGCDGPAGGEAEVDRAVHIAHEAYL
jgi:aldehyde dehydrogenase (NAD+)